MGEKNGTTLKFGKIFFPGIFSVNLIYFCPEKIYKVFSSPYSNFIDMKKRAVEK